MGQPRTRTGIVLFSVKVCGVTREEDVRALADAGADAIGINLVSASPRCVSSSRARTLRDCAKSIGLQVVVVVMDLDTQSLSQVMIDVEPDVLQLHGHERPESLPGNLISGTAQRMPIVKALSWTGRKEEVELARVWLEACGDRLAFLVDAYAPGVGGGTGRTARWDLLWPRPEPLDEVPLLLAGGLKPDNVAAGILETHCAGVDTASGVESAPGVKDHRLMTEFVTAARAALELLKQRTA